MQEFTYQGSILSFKDGLKEYHNLKNQFDLERLIIISNAMQYSLDYHKAGDFFGTIDNGIHDFAKKLIAKLSEYDIYDRTVSDMLGRNRSYAEYVKFVEVYTKSLKEIYEQRDQLTDSELAKAKARAESNIQGLGFSVYSSSLVSHLYYAAQESKEIKRQIKQAEAQYSAESSRITSEINSQVDKAIYDIYKEGTQTVFAIVGKCVDELFVFYTNELDKVGAIDTSCSEQMNDGRANELLQNIHSVQNPGKLLAKALQYSPYNLNIYKCAMEIGEINSDLVKIINYFEIGDSVSDCLIETYPAEYDYSKTAEQNIIDNRFLFASLSMIKNVAVNKIWNRFTTERREKYLDDMSSIVKYFYNLYHFSSNSDIKTQYGNRLEEDINNQINNDIDKKFKYFDEDIKFFEEDCFFEPFFASLNSKLDGVTINNYDDFMLLIKSKVHEKLENYHKRLEEEKVLEKKREEERKKEEKRKDEEKRKKIQTLVKAIACIIVLVIIAVLALNVIDNNNNKRRLEEANNLLENGNYVEALQIYNSLIGKMDVVDKSSEITKVVDIDRKIQNHYYAEALEELNKIKDDSITWYDWDYKINECTQGIYDQGISQYMNDNYLDAKETLSQISTYKNSDSYIEDCEKIISFSESINNMERLSAPEINNVQELGPKMTETIRSVMAATKTYKEYLGTWRRLESDETLELYISADYNGKIILVAYSKQLYGTYNCEFWAYKEPKDNKVFFELSGYGCGWDDVCDPPDRTYVNIEQIYDSSRGGNITRLVDLDYYSHDSKTTQEYEWGYKLSE